MAYQQENYFKPGANFSNYDAYRKYLEGNAYKVVNSNNNMTDAQINAAYQKALPGAGMYNFDRTNRVVTPGGGPQMAYLYGGKQYNDLNSLRRQFTNEFVTGRNQYMSQADDMWNKYGQQARTRMRTPMVGGGFSPRNQAMMNYIQGRVY